MGANFTEEEMGAFRASFEAFDENHDGVISTEELGEVMRSLGQYPSKAELQDIFDEVDTDRTGSIDFQDGDDDENELLKAFQVFDRDGSGTIDASELEQVMKAIGENLTKAEVDELIQHVDKDGDGTIDYNEFVRIMQEKEHFAT